MAVKRYLCVPILVLLFCCSGCVTPWNSAFSVQNSNNAPVIIDAGHGGADGGAVSADGKITESTVNLQIAHRLALLLCFCGQSVMMTRTDNADLSSADAATIREQKVSDLKNRAAAVNESNAAYLISIHQNSLPGHPKVHGAQVFFNTVSDSNRLADGVQTVLNSVVNSGNEKNCKAIDPDIYLMKEVLCPAILVECGFLSNDDEAVLLCTKEHQMELVLAIAAGYLQYRSEGKS